MRDPSTPVHVRVCRDCGEEYRPEAVRCADCGGELEDRIGGEGGATAEAAPRDEPPASELAGYRALFLTPRAADLVPMAERLREEQVEYRLAEQPGVGEGAPPRYALLVREADAAGALRALADLVAPHEDAEGIHAVETRFDVERGYVECPACGARTDPGAAECPECGLGLAPGEGEAEEPRD
jgi:ssDNA-binding Zn-finger/Zn-ribbon topoisomerase 1